MSRSLLLLVALASALPASASDIGSVHCMGNQDRVWVYDSLASFDVEAKLRCGETVEIVSRVKGFVRIRTANGVDGYVPDGVFPDLPPLEEKENAPASPAPRPTANASPVAAAPPAAASAPALVKSSASASVAPQPAKSATVTATFTMKAKAPASAPSAATISTVVPAKASVAPVSAVVPPRATSAPAPRDLAEAPPTTLPESSEDYPLAKPENESADPSCRIFFSAYGLAPAQYKWLVDNRRKRFSSICPAPDLARVDYVILFAHDSDSYLSSMPAPVHTDSNGFSDFSPITTMDTAIMSPSELEKARYEFVWVFRMKRGAFDPEKFSPRRRPQFTTDAKGSRASSKAVEDAFHFIEGQSPDR